MTRDEAIAVLNMVEAHGSLVVEAKDMAIKALEQEGYYKCLAQSYERTIVKLTEAVAERQPCEDCVSRQAVIDALDKRFDSVPMEQTTEILLLRKDLRELPPVTPTHKKGIWNILGCDLYMCSKCYAKFTHKFNYCPNCGAEMESEE